MLGRRADGYHDLESLVAFADCADRLTLEPGRRLSLTTRGRAPPIAGPPTTIWCSRQRALLAERVEGLRGGHFLLEKHLPVAAGIGGGSADAAAALRLLARLNGLAPDDLRVGRGGDS